LKRFGWGGKPKNLLISLVIVAYLMGSAVWQNNYHGVSAAQIIESFIFALFIGIDEDFFSRGFIFGALEQHGFWLAALLSSVNFGLLHFQNIIWGGQSAAYTITQVINAAGFGFLAVALMIYSGTIWIPILMHGLCDFPMQFETAIQYRKGVTGGGDWAGVLIDLLIYSVIGWFLIMLSDPARKDRMLNFGKKVGLVEPEAEVSQGR
jgi:membrane protease YdiL (CAAX protease family)